MNSISITKELSPAGERVILNFSGPRRKFKLDLTGTPFARVYEETDLIPFILLSIQAGVFDEEIEEQQADAPAHPESFLESLQRVLNNKN